MVEGRFSHGFLGIWNGCVKGFQPFHQLIAMAARSSARHKLIWCSPPLHGLVFSGFQHDTAVGWTRTYVQCHAQELRQRVKTTILCLLHSLLSEIQEC
jgi:hypothetical protein